MPKSGVKSLRALFLIAILSSAIIAVLPTMSAYAHSHRLHISGNLFTPSNQFRHVPQGEAIPSGLNPPKNLIVGPDCNQQCPPIIGTQKDDIIIATSTTDAAIFGLNGNDFIQCGQSTCKAFAGPGNNVLVAGLLDTDNSKLYGGSGNNIFIGGTGNSLMLGGAGNDQFFAGTGHDVMIGGGGANYFDCGLNGAGVILDFNPAHGDTKAGNCKFVIRASPNSSTNSNPSALLQ